MLALKAVFHQIFFYKKFLFENFPRVSQTPIYKGIYIFQTKIIKEKIQIKWKILKILNIFSIKIDIKVFLYV